MDHGGGTPPRFDASRLTVQCQKLPSGAGLSVSPGFIRVLTRKDAVLTMENERLSKPDMPAADARKTYCKPQLVEYGQVQELTQSGDPSILGETGPYAPISG
jgi:hypothetical protein